MLLLFKYMKTCFLTVLLYIIILNAYAQNNELLHKYYYHVNQAELSIIDNNLLHAQLHYDAAFSTEYEFSRDIFNAFVVSYRLQDTLRSIHFYNRMVWAGLKKENFEGLFGNKDTTELSDYYQYISIHYDSIHNIVSNSSMPALGIKFNEFYIKDQSCRTDEEKSKDLKRCDSLIEIDLMKFIDEYDFPSYKKIGLYDTALIQPFTVDILELIMFHKRGIIENTPFLDFMWKFVESGELDARAYSMRYFCQDCSPYHVNIPLRPISKDELKLINTERRKIYLEPLEDYYKKIDYSRNFQRKINSELFFVLVNDFCKMFNGENKLEIVE